MDDKSSNNKMLYACDIGVLLCSVQRMKEIGMKVGDTGPR